MPGATTVMYDLNDACSPSCQEISNFEGVVGRRVRYFTQHGIVHAFLGLDPCAGYMTHMDASTKSSPQRPLHRFVPSTWLQHSKQTTAVADRDR